MKEDCQGYIRVTSGWVNHEIFMRHEKSCLQYDFELIIRRRAELFQYIPYSYTISQYREVLDRLPNSAFKIKNGRLLRMDAINKNFQEHILFYDPSYVDNFEDISTVFIDICVDAAPSIGGSHLMTILGLKNDYVSKIKLIQIIMTL